MRRSCSDFKRENILVMVTFQKGIFVLAGTSFTGKTLLGRRLASKSNLKFLDVDEARKEIQADTTWRNPTEEKMIMIRAYALNHKKAEELLEKGIPVLLAATYSRPEYHSALRKLREKLNIPLQVFYLTISEQTVRVRLLKRLKEGSYSNIKSLENYSEQARKYVPIKGKEVKEINADRPIEEIEEDIMNVLSKYLC